MLVVVPNHVSEAINAEIDRFVKISPATEEQRQAMRNVLLAVFNEHGIIGKLALQDEAQPIAAEPVATVDPSGYQA